MIDDDIRGRMLAQILWTELEKIANFNQSNVEENKNLSEMKDGEKEVEREDLEEDEKDSIIGTSFIKNEKKKQSVKGIPIIKDRSQEGLRWDPSIQAYVPDFNIHYDNAKIEGKQEGIIEEKTKRLQELQQEQQAQQQQEQQQQEQQLLNSQEQEIQQKTQYLQQLKQEDQALQQQQ